MLYIADKNGEQEWHIGESFPRVEGSVIEFQADGEELSMIIDAIRVCSKSNVLIMEESKSEQK